MTKRSPFRYFRTSPEIIRLAVMMAAMVAWNNSEIAILDAGEETVFVGSKH